jgi:hypothetical protein
MRSERRAGDASGEKKEWEGGGAKRSEVETGENFAIEGCKVDNLCVGAR